VSSGVFQSAASRTLFKFFEDERFNKFVEVNAQEQVSIVSKHLLFKMLGENGQDLTLHGWTYGLNSGYVTDLG
jgi:carbonic anhydrase